MNLFDVLPWIAIIVLFALGKKWWSSLDKYFEKKAENFATKQDISEITLLTEQIHTDFKMALSSFDADIKFKYDFYVKQYNELYSKLFYIVCESEALRYILTKLAKENITFNEIPIIEYEEDDNMIENQSDKKSICDKIVNLISDKYVYASPSLIKLSCAYTNAEKCQPAIEYTGQKEQLKCQLKAEIVRTILKDYYWLRQQLLLQESTDETEKLDTGELIPMPYQKKTVNTNSPDNDESKGTKA